MVRAIAIVVCLLFVAATCGDDDSADSTASTSSSTSVVHVTEPESSTTTVAETTTTGSVPSDPIEEAQWPWHGPDASHSDPVSAVEEFVAFIGFENAKLSEFREGDSRSGEIDIDTSTDELASTGEFPTTAFVRLDSDDTWVVIGAASQAIEVDVPAHEATVSSPLDVHFVHNSITEGVVMQLWPDGAAEPIVSETVSQGGGVFAMDEFDATVSWETDVTGPATAIFRSGDPVPANVTTVRLELAG